MACVAFLANLLWGFLAWAAIGWRLLVLRFCSCGPILPISMAAILLRLLPCGCHGAMVCHGVSPIYGKRGFLLVRLEHHDDHGDHDTFICSFPPL